MLANDADADVQNAVYKILGTETTLSYGYYSETPIWWYRREQLDVVALSKSTNPRVRALMAGRLHQIAGDDSTPSHATTTPRSVPRRRTTRVSHSQTWLPYAMTQTRPSRRRLPARSLRTEGV